VYIDTTSADSNANRRYDGQASVEREAAPLSVQQDFHVAESQSNRGSVEYPQKRAAPPDPAKPANTGPATPPTKPGQPVPASPLANGAVLVDNYRVLYPTKAEDICINLIVCEKQFETPEELEARRAPPDGSRLAKRREDIKAFGGDLPMKSAYYYLPFELYAAPRDNNDKAVFEFITDDVKNHKMHAQNAAPAATLKLVTEHVIEVLGVLFLGPTDLTYAVANHGQICSLASRNRPRSQTEHNQAVACQSFLGGS
jgi:hypothetical protein